MSSDPDWVSVQDAAIRVNRSVSTIYAWVQKGMVRSWRPMRKTWVHLPDVLRVDREILPGRPRGA